MAEQPQNLQIVNGNENPAKPLTGRARSLANLKPFQKGNKGGGRPAGTTWLSRFIAIGKKKMKHLLPQDAAAKPGLEIWDKKLMDATVEAIYKAAIVDRDMAAAKILLERIIGPVPTEIPGKGGEPLEMKNQTLQIMMQNDEARALLLKLAEIQVAAPALPPPEAFLETEKS